MVSVPNIQPKAFLGGSIEEYRLVIGKGSTVLTEHIASGRKVPAVEAASSTLSKAAPLLKSGRGGNAAIAATATVAAVVTVYGAVQARRSLKEARALRVEVERFRQEQDADAQPAGRPILTSDPALLREREEVLVESAGEREQPASSVHGGSLESLLVDVYVAAADDDAPVTATVDWVHTAETQVAIARAERDQGATEDAVGRLRQLLFFLDSLPDEQDLPAHIAVEPLLALVELSLDVLEHPGETDDLTLADVEAWVARLRDLAAADEELSARLEPLDRRLEAARST